MRRLNNIPKAIDRIANPKERLIPARMGSGKDYVAISTGTPRLIWVTYEGSGIFAKVWNLHLPAKPGLRVLVGEDKDYPGLLQVVRERLTPGEFPSVQLGNHHETHELYGDDEVRVYGGQVMPLNVVPIPDVLSVIVWGAVVMTGSVWTNVPTQNVDLTSSLPTTGALWALLQTNSTGTVTIKLSTAVATKSLLTINSIPAPDENYFPICAIALYVGQSEIQRNSIFNDIIDLRWGNGYLGGGIGDLFMSPAIYDPRGIANDVFVKVQQSTPTSPFVGMLWYELNITAEMNFSTADQSQYLGVM
jgi:hypothetical protein